ncbi:MAG: sigma-70 family RNA polymerase sigma factor [Hominimerdicola sp.]
MSRTRISFDTIDNYISTDIFSAESSKKSSSKTVIIRKLLFENLTEKQKSYIILYYRDNLSMEEIAKRFGVAKSTVSRTISRGRNRILQGMKTRLLRRIICTNIDGKDS